MTTASIILTIVATLLLWLVTYGVQITARFEDDRMSRGGAMEPFWGRRKGAI